MLPQATNYLVNAKQKQINMQRYLPTLILIVAAIILHGILWSRNAAFLWSRRRLLLAIVVIAELWQLITDPIGSIWGAWKINPDQVLGIWLFGVGVTPIDNLLGIALVSSVTACAVLVFGYGPRRWI
jgi:hypothetical protein